MTSCQMICLAIITESVCGPHVNGRVYHFKEYFDATTLLHSSSVTKKESYPHFKYISKTSVLFWNNCVTIYHLLHLRYQRQPVESSCLVFSS